MGPAQLSIQQILENVAKYQHAVHGLNYATLATEERISLMRKYVLALHVEQAELLNEIPWKPWKYAKSTLPKTLKTPEAIAEWVDCLFFLIDQALVLKISAEDITETFFAVLNKNYDRKQMEGVPTV